MSVYLPKGPNNNNTEWLKNIQYDKQTNFIITGDFNAHSSFWEQNCSNVTSTKFVNNIIDSPFFLLNDGQITRIPDILHHRPTSIDLTLVSPNLAPLCYWKTWPDTLNSDHLPIITTIQDLNK